MFWWIDLFFDLAGSEFLTSDEVQTADFLVRVCQNRPEGSDSAANWAFRRGETFSFTNRSVDLTVWPLFLAYLAHRFFLDCWWTLAQFLVHFGMNLSIILPSCFRPCVRIAFGSLFPKFLNRANPFFIKISWEFMYYLAMGLFRTWSICWQIFDNC